MNAIEVAQNNFNSWNRHDADSIVAAYAQGGTYRTPLIDHPLTGQAIGDFAKSVWAAFPDATLEVILLLATLEEAWWPYSGSCMAPTPVH